MDQGPPTARSPCRCFALPPPFGEVDQNLADSVSGTIELATSSRTNSSAVPSNGSTPPGNSPFLYDKPPPSAMGSANIHSEGE